MANVLKYAIIVWFLFISVFSYYDEEEQKPTILTAAVGNWVIFDCEVEFPQNIPIPYQLNWKKHVRYYRLHIPMYNYNNKMFNLI